MHMLVRPSKSASSKEWLFLSVIGRSGEPQIVNHFMESILLDLWVGTGEKLTLEAGCAKHW
jgi:hypothetical protein